MGITSCCLNVYYQCGSMSDIEWFIQPAPNIADKSEFGNTSFFNPKRELRRNSLFGFIS